MPTETIISYKPHDNQILFHNSRAQERIIVAAIRSGKTHALLHDIIVEAWNNKSGFGILLVGPTAQQLRDILMRPLYIELLEMNLVSINGWNKTENIITLLNGNLIYGRSAEAYEKIRGLNIKDIYIDEAALISKECMDVVRGRLVTTNGRLTIATTPKGKNNWVYEDYFRDGHNDNTETFHFNIFDNPIITCEAVERLRADYDEQMAQQELEGKFVSLYESLVYRSFTRDKNLFDNEFNINNYQLYAGIDWNINKYGCCIAIKSEDKVYVIDEIYGSKDVDELAQRMISKYGRDIIICSDSANAQSHRKILRNHGLNKLIETKSNPRRVDRYNLVNALFRNANNISKLFIERSACPTLLNDIENLSFKLNTDVPDTRGEKLGHITDGLGYLLKYLMPSYGVDRIKKTGRWALKDMVR